MAKSLEFKLRVIKRVLEEGESKQFVGFSEGCTFKSIQTWIKVYNKDGIEGLKPSKSANSYSSTFKSIVLEHMQKEHVTVGVTSKKFGIPRQTLHTWKKQVEVNSLAKISNSVKVLSLKKIDKINELDVLIDENRKLRMELDVLKKLDALVLLKRNNTEKN